VSCAWDALILSLLVDHPTICLWLHSIWQREVDLILSTFEATNKYIYRKGRDLTFRKMGTDWVVSYMSRWAYFNLKCVWSNQWLDSSQIRFLRA